MKFKPRKVKFIWNKKLEGKKGYIANNVNELKEIVEGDCYSELTTVTEGHRDAFSFKDDIGSENRFFYPVSILKSNFLINNNKRKQLRR